MLDDVANVIGPQQIPDAADGEFRGDQRRGDPVGDRATTTGCAGGRGKVATSRRPQRPRCGGEEQEDRRSHERLDVVASPDVRRRKRVAVCGGAGDSLLDTVADAGVQAYVTADLRHHPADEHRRASDVALVDVAHWASEFPWCTQAADLLRSNFGDSLPVRVSAVRTDPWNVERNET
jgi:putative NIF3 family GTP cyclohydrolase 1 type 2